jgi:hypothetical protein
MVVIAPIVATVAFAGAASPVFAANHPVPAPTVSSFTASTTSLTYLGGKVVLTATVANATSCKLKVSPSLGGFPKSFPCSTSVRKSVTLGKNRSAAALSYSFSLTVKNKTASAAAPLVVVAEAAVPSPVISSFTVSNASLPFAGGKLELKASLEYGSSCELNVSPSLRGFPKSFPCSKTVKQSITFGENKGVAALSYSFSLTVKNKTASVVSPAVVVAEAAPPPVPAPVVSSFTASKTSLSDAGGKIELKASFSSGATCKMTVTPTLKGFSDKFPCSTSAHRFVTLSGDKGENPVQYTFGLTVENKTSSVAATSVVVEVAAPPPPLSFSPSSLTFASEGVFVADDPMIVTVHNNAATTQNISAVAVGSVGEPTDFILNRNNCTYLTAYESCSFAIQFQPTGTGPRTGIVDIVDSSWGTAGGVGHVDLSGTGVWATATVSNANITDNVLNFPVEGVLAPSAPQYVTVTNAGSVPLYISGIGVTGAESTDFSIQAGTCINLLTNSYPFVVGIGQSCSFGVSFDPSSASTRETNVVVDDNTIGTQTQLQAQGTGAYTTDTVNGTAQSADPVDVDLGSTSITGEGDSTTITIANTGSVTLAFTGASISGINADEFSVKASTTCAGSGIEVAVANSCTVEILFNPAALGTRTATLKIGDNTSGGFETVDLSGTGTP